MRTTGNTSDRRRLDRARTVATRMGRSLLRLRAAAGSGAGRQISLTVAALLFVVLALLSVRSADLRLDQVDWWVLGPVSVLGPLATIALNAAEFRSQAHLVSTSVGVGSALRTSVLASGANLLPIPGAVLVRLAALTGKGVSRAAAGWSTAVVGQVWASTSSFIAAIGFATNDLPLVALGALALSAVFGAMAAATQRSRLPEAAPGRVGEIALVELGIVVVGALRLYFTFVGFGLEISPGQVAALTVSAVIASAAGVFPGGLGLREGLIGLTGGMVGVDLADSVVVASFDRVGSLLVLGVAALALLASPRITSWRRAPLSDPLPSRMEADERR